MVLPFWWSYGFIIVLLIIAIWELVHHSLDIWIGILYVNAVLGWLHKGLQHQILCILWIVAFLSCLSSNEGHAYFFRRFFRSNIKTVCVVCVFFPLVDALRVSHWLAQLQVSGPLKNHTWLCLPQHFQQQHRGNLAGALIRHNLQYVAQYSNKGAAVLRAWGHNKSTDAAE